MTKVNRRRENMAYGRIPSLMLNSVGP